MVIGAGILTWEEARLFNHDRDFGPELCLEHRVCYDLLLNTMANVHILSQRVKFGLI